MNVLPAVMTIINVLPKVAPTLRALKELFSNEPTDLTDKLTGLKKAVKAATIAVLTLKVIIQETPSERDNEAFDKSLAALKEIRNNLDEVIKAAEK